MSRLINAAAVKRLLLDKSKDMRTHEFTQVSATTLALAESAVRNFCLNHIRSAPSKGKTL